MPWLSVFGSWRNLHALRQQSILRRRACQVVDIVRVRVVVEGASARMYGRTGAPAHTHTRTHRPANIPNEKKGPTSLQQGRATQEGDVFCR